jgi:hypothetical protein
VGGKRPDMHVSFLSEDQLAVADHPHQCRAKQDAKRKCGQASPGASGWAMMFDDPYLFCALSRS